MFHLCAFEEAIGTTANTDLDAIRDDVLNVENSHFKLLKPMDLVAAMAFSASLNRGRITCPSFRQVTPAYIRPIEVDATPGDGMKTMDLRHRPLTIPAFEQIAVELSSAIACGTEQAYSLLWLSPRLTPAPSRQPFLIRGTSSTAAVANTWTNVSVAWEQTPVAGKYAVTGLWYTATAGVAARIIFQSQTLRPGVYGVDSADFKVHPMFLNGGLGQWGSFDADTFPEIEVLNPSTNNDHVFLMEIMPLFETRRGGF